VSAINIKLLGASKELEASEEQKRRQGTLLESVRAEHKMEHAALTKTVSKFRNHAHAMEAKKDAPPLPSEAMKSSPNVKFRGRPRSILPVPPSQPRSLSPVAPAAEAVLVTATAATRAAPTASQRRGCEEERREVQDNCAAEMRCFELEKLLRSAEEPSQLCERGRSARFALLRTWCCLRGRNERLLRNLLKMLRASATTRLLNGLRMPRA